MDTRFNDTLPASIDGIMQRSWSAFQTFRKRPASDRAMLLREIATGIEALGDALISTAMRETNLPEARLRNERGRTIFQLTSYADACERGDWMDIRIDTAIPERNPPKPDVRKMMVPLGPVVVYGSSNFPFAYSTAGGDTACAFAAGCSVVVKAHPAHPETSTLVAEAIMAAALRCGLPEDVLIHVHGISHETGKALVTHPHTKAVGFTGSYTAGRTIFDWANGRPSPIPVFAEMGSVNPVFLLPEKLASDAVIIARDCASSITLGTGQFCTNPGLIIGVEGPHLDKFTEALGDFVGETSPSRMLHPGIASAFREKMGLALTQKGMRQVTTREASDDGMHGTPAIATVDGASFLRNPLLHQEVFGPFSIVVRCRDMEEMLQVATEMEGQLTGTVMGTLDDVRNHSEMISVIQGFCGRFILNTVPTGVEVCLSMHHGGPFPASTDSRFTSVGADGIRRFSRPIAWQNWPNELLPDELKNDNPLSMMRTVNNEPSTGIIEG